MQCVNCQFQNMPGTSACARCGSSMSLATAVMDVHPPRASRAAKKVRRVLPVDRIVNRIKGETFVSAPVRRALPMGRMAIPGWYHFHAGLPARGHVYLWLFVAFLLPALPMFGSTNGSILIGLAFSVHSTEALNIVLRHRGDLTIGQRMGISILVPVILFAIVYLPLGWLLTRVADPTSVLIVAEPFAQGDVVLVNHWATPRIGDVVLYDLVEYTLARGTHQTFVHAGQRFDRIIAAAGDTVKYDGHKLLVNGVSPRRMPLNPAHLPTCKFELTVPPDTFCIVPTTSPNVTDDAGLWEHLALVPTRNIIGRVYLRNQPFSRFRIIH